jgi:hypothetical protein
MRRFACVILALVGISAFGADPTLPALAAGLSRIVVYHTGFSGALGGYNLHVDDGPTISFFAATECAAIDVTPGAHIVKWDGNTVFGTINLKIDTAPDIGIDVPKGETRYLICEEISYEAGSKGKLETLTLKSQESGESDTRGRTTKYLDMSMSGGKK